MKHLSSRSCLKPIDRVVCFFLCFIFIWCNAQRTTATTNRCHFFQSTPPLTLTSQKYLWISLVFAVSPVTHSHKWGLWPFGFFTVLSAQSSCLLKRKLKEAKLSNSLTCEMRRLRKNPGTHHVCSSSSSRLRRRLNWLICGLFTNLELRQISPVTAAWHHRVSIYADFPLLCIHLPTNFQALWQSDQCVINARRRPPDWQQGRRMQTSGSSAVETEAACVRRSSAKGAAVAW